MRKEVKDELKIIIAIAVVAILIIVLFSFTDFILVPTESN